MIDVGSEWRTFSNEKSGVDPSRVGGPENPLLNGSDLSTMIGPGRGDASFDDFGISKYQNRRTVSLLYLSFHLFDNSAVRALVSNSRLRVEPLGAKSQCLNLRKSVFHDNRALA